jgi:hypothetical protein
MQRSQMQLAKTLDNDLSLITFHRTTTLGLTLRSLPLPAGLLSLVAALPGASRGSPSGMTTSGACALFRFEGACEAPRIAPASAFGGAGD